MLTPCVGTSLNAVGIENTSFRHWQNTSHANTYLSGYTSPPCDYVIQSDSSLLKLLASRGRSYSVTYPFLISMKRSGWVKSNYNIEKKPKKPKPEKNDPGDFTFLWPSLCFLLRRVLAVCFNKYLGANCQCFISKENQGCILTSCLSQLIRCQTWLKSSGICFKS